jgi:excisionase family DNA binding protein
MSILSTVRSKEEPATGRCPIPDPAAHKLAFTIKEAARASGLSRSFIYIAIGQGALPARKCGARTLILHSDLQRFLRGLPRFTKRETNGEAAP